MHASEVGDDETRRILLEKLSEKERTLVEKSLKPGERVLSVAKGDLGEDGSFSTYLFIVTNERVLKIDAEYGNKIVELEIKKATQVVFNDYLGNSELILIVDGKEFSLARFSR
ncbi:MAG: PH domain-containing protein [Candidatus Brockarchaeota archaeon]|nr:PH domain-containing protein [Candidatus Brockarchaeota archaeon]MBO3809183.1 PH domain-containing protein [Candidatus Brockarchaeota archaeon]